MNAIATQTQIQTRTGSQAPIRTTLLELVRALSEVTRDENELVAAVIDLLESGRARLTGNMRELPVSVFRRALYERN